MISPENFHIRMLYCCWSFIIQRSEQLKFVILEIRQPIGHLNFLPRMNHHWNNYHIPGMFTFSSSHLERLCFFRRGGVGEALRWSGVWRLFQSRVSWFCLWLLPSGWQFYHCCSPGQSAQFGRRTDAVRFSSAENYIHGELNPAQNSLGAEPEGQAAAMAQPPPPVVVPQTVSVTFSCFRKSSESSVRSGSWMFNCTHWRNCWCRLSMPAKQNTDTVPSTLCGGRPPSPHHTITTPVFTVFLSWQV